ncbi:MAG: tRNA (adenosine(37)-N6)-threonylcarbamoyltransferase complex dimerization subunit type 1 TsaB [Pyrinomonadaceae bacterium]
MIILAIDGVYGAGSVAVAIDGVVRAISIGNGDRTASEILPQLIQTVIADADVDLNSIEKIAVNIGPGSFTGLRVGNATALGIARQTGADVIGVPANLALAQSLEHSIINTIVSIGRNEIAFAAICNAFEFDFKRILIKNFEDVFQDQEILTVADKRTSELITKHKIPVNRNLQFISTSMAEAIAITADRLEKESLRFEPNPIYLRGFR